MLITTSRRPGHRARILARELCQVIPGAVYVPRGVKTIRKLMGLANRMGKRSILVICSEKGIPRELRFLVDGGEWRWEEFLKLKRVVLLRDLKQKPEKVVGVLSADKKLAERFSRLFCLPTTQAREGAVVRITHARIEFVEGDRVIGPAFEIEGWGRAPGGESA